MKRTGTIAVLAVLTVGTGCASYQTSGSSRAALPLPAEIQQYYRYLSVDPTVTARTIERHADYSVKDVTLFEPGASEPIQIVWFAPKLPGPRPLILISPIRGSDTIVVDDCARVFASCGYHAAIIKRARSKFDPDGPLSQVEDTLHAAVIRHRQALDWLLEQPGVDPDRIATFGISYGAIIDAALAAVEPRVKIHVIDLAGGPLAGVMRSSDELGLRRSWDCIRRGHDLTSKQVYEDLENVICTDPVKLAPYVARDDVLMLIARFDHSVPTRYQLKLWHALGKPRADFVLLGHYTSILALPAHRLSIMKFLEEKFAEQRQPPAIGVVQAKK
jgi:X-Pro dipeptidyl-peptidase (S15 family)